MKRRRGLAVAVGQPWRLLFAPGAVRGFLPFAGTAPLESPADLADLAELTARTIAHSRLAISRVHLMGTARMGGDPLRAVCDSSGRVHDRAGLVVAVGSLLPHPLGIHPQATIMVVATLVARDLITARQDGA